MAIDKKVKRSPQEYADELKDMIRAKFPNAEFTLHRMGAGEYNLIVNEDLDDMFDVLRRTSQRVTDILVESGIHIHVLPLGRRQDSKS